jgi:hypothetical protein
MLAVSAPADSVAQKRVPGPNDVVMRTLEFREVAPGSPMDVFQAIRDFHVTRLEWTYLDFDDRNRRNVEKVKSTGVLFGGAGSASLHESIKQFPAQPEAVHMVDLDGKPIVQPHMRKWDHFRGIGDPSNPAYFDHHLAYYKKIIDWGGLVLHRDEPEAPVFAAQRYGGGFSPTGVAGFRAWLKRNLPPSEIADFGIPDIETFDYSAWLRVRGAPSGDAFAKFDDPLKPYWIRYWTDTTTDFWRRLLLEIKKHANDSEIAFSCNNSSLQMWEPYHREFDYANAELLLETAHPKHIWERAREARQLGKIQIFGAPKTRSQPVSELEKKTLLRRVYATAYACGMLAKVPWDVYDQSPDGSARYFTAPADFADLCAFVRASDWNGYSEVSVSGPDLSDGNKPAPQIVGHGGVYAFERRTIKPESPRLIHLVDWGRPISAPAPSTEFVSPTGQRFLLRSPEETMKRTAPEPFVLLLPHEEKALRADFHLLVPAKYDATAHVRAVETGDYSALVERIPLSPEVTKDGIRLAIPALTPWGVVTITPSPLS